VICAVRIGGAVGVDVECAARDIDPRLFQSPYLSRDEAAAIAARAPPARARAFLRLWTLKEAYAKARGLGMSLPFDSFSICPRSNATP
jgi:4'-phosphopantetheinyl transferase